MTYVSPVTKLEGFPHFYDSSLVMDLNLAYNCVSGFMRKDIGEFGRAVSSKCRYVMELLTNDSYDWYGSLQYELNPGKVMLLFPWKMDNSNVGSTLDRSIALFTDVPVSLTKLDGLIKKVCNELTFHAFSRGL